jgi:N-acetylated-alpha-linked acidic dipeptidase
VAPPHQHQKELVMHHVRRLAAATLLLAALAAPAAAQHPTEQRLESTFDAALSADSLRAWMKVLSARPHHVGSPYGKHNAEFIAGKFRSWGLDTEIEEFQVLFPTPAERLLEMTAPTQFTAALAEDALAEDATSGQTSEQLPVYNAYSVDGDVTGTLVYVNYGIPSDYDDLERLGIDVKGAVVIARYGGAWRGIKPKVAAEHGAIGCIIYSDPRDDGYYQGDVYPTGAFRNESGAQRGSVADMPVYPGDPLTPFVGATKEAKRLPQSEAKTLTKIPVLPISYRDALPLLKALGGRVAPDDWRGALPLTYHIGPGPARVHLRLSFHWDLAPIYDVIGTIRGTEYPDQWVIRGNHHDAWVNGASDPVSGLVAEMAEARSLGTLLKQGWKPKRTIVYAAWDGEEPGLLGSTEWVEAHADALKQNAVVYINSDSNGRGFLGVGGSHTLEKFSGAVARDITDPETNVSVADRGRARALTTGSPAERQEARDRSEPRIGPLGSGSDFTPFLQHLGIASLNIGYGGENDGGSYHSIYDSFDHYTRFGDPTFAYGVALAKTGGRMVLRMADAEVPPFEFSNFTETVGKFVQEVHQLADRMRDETAAGNALVADKSYALAADPTETTVLPQPKDPVPFLNFAPLENAFASLQRSSNAYRDAKTKFDAAGKPLAAPARKSLGEILYRAERVLLSKQGLPGRPWFAHQIYAPGLYTGYGVKTLPGVREAIEQRNWKEAEDEIGITSDAIEAFAREIDKAAKILQG